MSENEIKTTNNGRFVKAKDRYADMKSSALCLFIISIAGIIITVLDCFDMLPIKLNANNSWIFYFAMYALYGIFFIIGVFTVKSAKKVKSTISDEESETDTIITWAMDNLTAEYIDNECRRKRDEQIKKEQFTTEETDAFDDLPDELKCFDREEVISSKLKEQFNLDNDSYIASILEEIYPEIFE